MIMNEDKIGRITDSNPPSLREPAFDRRWHALASGELSDAEVLELRSATEQSDEGKLLWELYRPCDDAEKEALFQRMHARIHADARRPWRRLSDGWNRLSPATRVAPFVLAAAAALPPVYHALQPGALAALSIHRGPADGYTTLAAPDDPFTLTIVPRRGLRVPLQVLGGLLVGNGSSRPWAASPNPSSPEGEIVITGTRQTLFPCVPDGVWDLLVAVGPSGEAPTASEMLRDAAQGSSGHRYQVLKTRVVLEGAGVDAKGGSSCDTAAP